MSAYLVPCLTLGLVGFAITKGVDVYACFCEGGKRTIEFLKGVLPCLGVIFTISAISEACGWTDALERLLSPLVQLCGVPEELMPLLLIKPLSGAGALGELTAILQRFGADSFVGRCACVVYGSTETVFYLSAVYFSSTKKVKLFGCIALVLACSFLGAVIGCFLCRVL